MGVMMTACLKTGSDVKIPDTNNCCSVLIIPLTNVHDYCFLSEYPHQNSQGVTEATQIVTKNERTYTHTY
jgi:hypothetical protein